MSTAMVDCPKAVLSTTLAVFRPTPGSASSSCRVEGTFPMLIVENPASTDDICRFGVVQPDGSNMTLEFA